MLKYSSYLEWSKDKCGELQRSISDKLVSKLKAAGFEVSRFSNIMKDLELEECSIDSVVNRFEILYYIAGGKVRTFHNINRRYSEEYTHEYVLNELEQADRFCEFMNSEE